MHIYHFLIKNAMDDTCIFHIKNAIFGFLVMFDNRCAYKRCLTPVFAWCLRRPMTGNPSKLDFFKRPFVSGVIHTIFRVC